MGYTYIIMKKKGLSILSFISQTSEAFLQSTYSQILDVLLWQLARFGQIRREMTEKISSSKLNEKISSPVRGILQRG